MPYRPGARKTAKLRQVATWPNLPERVFTDLGIDRDALGAFSHALIGEIVLPGEGGYEAAARTSYQATTHRPKIIVYCEVEADVRCCLQWAERHGWWVTPRSGGHSTAGYSVNDGMVIDVSRMKSVYVDPATMTATVGAGTNFGTLNAILNSYKLHVPGGACPDVGIAGYMQGGGYGYTSRAFGMNCDNVIAFRMMLCDGRTVTANALQNADLFWAVRGGTGNNFGILIDVTYRLRPVWKIWAFGLAWSWDAAPRVLAEMQTHYMRGDASPKLGYMALITRRADFGHQPMLTMRGVYTGSAEDGRNELAKLLAIGDPVFDVDRTLPYFDAIEALDEHDLLDMPWDKVKEDKQAGYIDRPLAEADWRQVLDHFADAPAGTWGMGVIEPYGGAISHVAPDACAFVHRDVDMDFFVDTFWAGEGDATRARAWLDGLMEMMAPFSNGQVYQNYPRRTLTDPGRRYFAGNHDRLLAVKNKYDPVPRTFHFEQGLATSRVDPGHPVTPQAGEFAAGPIVYEPHSEERDGESSH